MMLYAGSQQNREPDDDDTRPIQMSVPRELEALMGKTRKLAGQEQERAEDNEHHKRSPVDQREHSHIQLHDLLHSPGLRRCPRTRSWNPYDLQSNGILICVPTVYLMRPLPPIPSTSTKQALSSFPSHEGRIGPNPTRTVPVVSHPSSVAVQLAPCTSPLPPNPNAPGRAGTAAPSSGRAT